MIESLSEREEEDALEEAFPINLHLKEASSLVHIMTNDPSPEIQSWGETHASISEYLMTHIQDAISIREVNAGTGRPRQQTTSLPALSRYDWSILQSSWITCLQIWKSLKHQRCAFHTINDGAETVSIDGIVLDNHYSAQLRQLSRESMLEELQATAEELESYLLEAEDRHKIFLELTEPVWKRLSSNGNDSMVMPMPIGPSRIKMAIPNLAVAPGYIHQAAIASMDQAKESYESLSCLSDFTVRRVYSVFNRIDENEFRFWLKDRNSEIVERLMQIQNHQLNLLEWFDDSQWTGELTVEARFFGKFAPRPALCCKGRCKIGRPKQAPLLELHTAKVCCYVTANRILFVERGASPKITSFDLRSSVRIEVSSCSSLRLLASGDIAYTFRPPTSICPKTLKTFLDTLRELGEVKTMEDRRQYLETLCREEIIF